MKLDSNKMFHVNVKKLEEFSFVIKKLNISRVGILTSFTHLA